MARRRPPRRPTQARDPLDAPHATLHRWPHLQVLIDLEGSLTIGRISKTIDAAVAHDPYMTYAMLRRRDGETLIDLLTRLDQAVGKAVAEDKTVDEINTR